jgi:flagellar biosynthetic protein FliR
MIEINIADFYLYILVLVRMIGLVAFNPILNQKGVPAMIRTGLSIALTILIAPGLDFAATDTSGLLFFVALFKELLIGLALGYICSIFYYLLVAMGEILDMQIGLSMAKVMDPNTNLQMGVSDKLLNFLFMMLFFVSSCHLLLFKMILESFEFSPVGPDFINIAAVGSYCAEVFVDTFAMVLKITVPIVTAEFLLEIGLGILMKLIPAIHIFVINLQLKIAVGLLLLFVLAAPMSEFINKYFVDMFDAMRKGLEIF